MNAYIAALAVGQTVAIALLGALIWQLLLRLEAAEREIRALRAAMSTSQRKEDE
jgi:hypothetical protein